MLSSQFAANEDDAVFVAALTVTAIQELGFNFSNDSHPRHRLVATFDISVVPIRTLSHYNILQFRAVDVAFQEHVSNDLQGILLFTIVNLFIGNTVSESTFPLVDLVCAKEEGENPATQARWRHLHKLTEGELLREICVATEPASPKCSFEDEE